MPSFGAMPAISRTMLRWCAAWSLIAGSLVVGSTQAAADEVQPVGYFDSMGWAGPGLARVTGWATTPPVAGSSTPQPSIQVAVYVDAVGVPLIADHPRPDVAEYFGVSPAVGSWGFDAVIPVPAGTHRVCAYAIGGTNPLLRCVTYAPPSDPIGVVDTAVDGPLFAGPTGQITVTGWSFDPDVGAGPGLVDGYIQGFTSGLYGVRVITDLPRPDVQAAYGLADDRVGFQFSLAYRGAACSVRLYGVNQSGPGGNPLFFDQTSTTGFCDPNYRPGGN